MIAPKVALERFLKRFGFLAVAITLNSTKSSAKNIVMMLQVIKVIWVSNHLFLDKKIK